jgi:hypothetical protein
VNTPPCPPAIASTPCPCCTPAAPTAARRMMALICACVCAGQLATPPRSNLFKEAHTTYRPPIAAAVLSCGYSTGRVGWRQGGEALHLQDAEWSSLRGMDDWHNDHIPDFFHVSGDVKDVVDTVVIAVDFDWHAGAQDTYLHHAHAILPPLSPLQAVSCQPRPSTSSALHTPSTSCCAVI